MGVNHDAHSSRPLVEEDLAKMASFMELPDLAMPLDGVVILQYLDPDGETRLVFRTTDSYHSHSIGMLYMAAWQLMHMSNHEEETDGNS